MQQDCDDAGKSYYDLYRAYQYGDLKELPALFSRVVRDGLWKKWTWVGQEFTATSIVEYIEKSPPYGLGASVEIFKKLIDPILLGGWQRATKATHGGDHKSEEYQEKIKTDNISLDPQHGTSRAYTLDRLEREHPALYAKVVAGEMSANKAAIEAGFARSSHLTNRS